MWKYRGFTYISCTRNFNITYEARIFMGVLNFYLSSTDVSYMLVPKSFTYDQHIKLRRQPLSRIIMIVSLVINGTGYHIRTLNTSHKNILDCPIRNIAQAITGPSRSSFHNSVHREPSWWRSSERWPLDRVSIRIRHYNSHVSTIDRLSTHYRLKDYIWLEVYLRRQNFRKKNHDRLLCSMIESILTNWVLKYKSSTNPARFLGWKPNFMHDLLRAFIPPGSWRHPPWVMEAFPPEWSFHIP